MPPPPKGLAPLQTPHVAAIPAAEVFPAAGASKSLGEPLKDAACAALDEVDEVEVFVRANIIGTHPKRPPTGVLWNGLAPSEHEGGLLARRAVWSWMQGGACVWSGRFGSSPEGAPPAQRAAHRHFLGTRDIPERGRVRRSGVHLDARRRALSPSLGKPFWVRLFGWRVAERDTQALALHASTLPTSRSPQFMLMVRDGARKSPHGARSTGREGRTHTSKRTALSLLLSRTLLLCAALGPCARRGRCREQYTSRRGLVHAPATS